MNDETVKFIGACNGVKEETGRPWFMVFLARWSEKYKSWTVWKPVSVEESEYSELTALKFGDEFSAHFFNGYLKSFTIIPTKNK